MTLFVSLSKALLLVASLMVFMPFMGTWFGVPAIFYLAISSMMLGIAFISICRHRFISLSTVILYVSFCTLLIGAFLATFYADFRDMNFQHLAQILVLTSIVLSLGAIQPNPDLNSFRRMLLAISAVVVIVVFYEVVLQLYNRALSQKIHANYLVVSSALGISALVSFCSLVYERRLSLRLIAILVFLMSIIGLGGSLARGALVSTFVIITTLLFFIKANQLGADSHRSIYFDKYFVSRRWISFVRLVSIFVLAGGLAVALATERTRSRFMRLFSGTELEQGGRGELWSTTISEIERQPFWGHGVGSSPRLLSETVSSYPHNFLLQSYLEIGLVGFLFFVIFCLSCWIFFLVKEKDPARIFVFSLFSFVFMEYMKSFDLWTARNFFIFGCLFFISYKLSFTKLKSPMLFRDVK